MLLPGMGAEGQARLHAGHVVIVGCGALGCAVADQLVRAGVGTVLLIDRDLVELSNLQRQVLFDEHDASAALPKAEAARRRLVQINSLVRVEAVVADFSPSNAEQLTVATRPDGISLLLDGTDNFETRYLLNDLAVKHRLPYIYGGVVGTRGMQASFLPGTTACLRCLFPEPPAPGSAATCDTAGVLGPAVAMVAARQAADAIKLLLGRDDLLSGLLLEFDLWTCRQRELALGNPRNACPCCQHQRFEFLDAAHAPTAVLCGQQAVQINPTETAQIDLAGLAQRLAPHGDFRQLGHLLLRGTLTHEREGETALHLTLFPDGRAIIRGTADAGRARAVYARYVGT